MTILKPLFSDELELTKPLFDLRVEVGGEDSPVAKAFYYVDLDRNGESFVVQFQAKPENNEFDVEENPPGFYFSLGEDYWTFAVFTLEEAENLAKRLYDGCEACDVDAVIMEATVEFGSVENPVSR